MRTTTIRLLLLSFLMINYSIAAKKSSEAEADLTSLSNKNINAVVLFKDTSEGLRITAHATGLTPNSTHGFHIHEVGKCEGPEYKTAGDHFNPTKMKHGAPESEKSHMGDMGNLTANDKGEAHLELVLAKADAKETKELIGKSVLIHEKADDYKTQPSGGSGARIACGVIKML